MEQYPLPPPPRGTVTPGWKSFHYNMFLQIFHLCCCQISFNWRKYFLTKYSLASSQSMCEISWVWKAVGCTRSNWVGCQRVGKRGIWCKTDFMPNCDLWELGLLLFVLGAVLNKYHPCARIWTRGWLRGRLSVCVGGGTYVHVSRLYALQPRYILSGLFLAGSVQRAGAEGVYETWNSRLVMQQQSGLSKSEQADYLVKIKHSAKRSTEIQ